MTIAAIIVAAGRGMRAGGKIPKQWQMLAGRPMIEHTIAAFAAAPGIARIVVVLHPDDQATYNLDDTGITIATGGADRSASVRNGLYSLDKTDTTKVLIHDAARPCVSQRLIADVIGALDHAQAAAPALAVTDALWVGQDARVSGTRDRSGLFLAQTPQGFHLGAILAAHADQGGNAADDVEVARAAGLEVVIVTGDADNLKVTTPGDFARAERILGA